MPGGFFDFYSKSFAQSTEFSIFYCLFFCHQKTAATMRKYLALTGLLTLLSISVYLISCNNDKSETKGTATTDSTEMRLKRGEYLFQNVAGCVDCHSQRDFTLYSGPIVKGTEGGGGMEFNEKVGIPGVLYGKNITPDPETGIGTWTDEEIIRALTQGINKKGDTLFPIMPYPHYNHASKEDLLSIIAYVRTLKPIKNKVPDRKLMIPIAMAYPGPVLQPSIENNVAPRVTDKVKYGEYLANMAECATCHSPLTQQGPDMSRMYAGGYRFEIGGFVVNSANITSDSATGIGSWTDQQFMNKFLPYREEANYNFKAGKQNTIMPLSLHAGMTDEDLRAIWAYLKTVKPITNKVEKYPTQ
jgi:mono/diheme cytochrome c family protein